MREIFDKLITFFRESHKPIVKHLTERMYGSISIGHVTEAKNESLAGAGISFAGILTIIGENSSISLTIALIMFSISLPFHVAIVILHGVFQVIGE